MYMEKQEKVALFPHRLTVLLLELVNLHLPPKGDFWHELHWATQVYRVFRKIVVRFVSFDPDEVELSSFFKY